MKRPHVLVNVAMTADGKIDSIARKGALISSEPDKARVDHLRASVDAVLVGGRTLLDEDPKLTIKSQALREQREALGLPENPVKIGVVSVADVKLDGEFMTAGFARRLIYTTSRTPKEQIARLEAAGVQVFISDGEQVDLPTMLGSLYELGIRKLLVEGGGTLLAEFFRLDLVDELTVYISPMIFGGASAPTPADGAGFLPEQALRLQLVTVEKFDEGGGILIHYTCVQKGDELAARPTFSTE